MNQFVGIGNLTKDPEVRYSTGQNQTAVCRFTLAINDKRKNPQTGEWEDNPSYIPIVVFGKQAENCGRFLAKGSKVAVSGRVQTGSYEKNGQKVYTTDIVANGVEFLTPKSESTSSEPQQGVINEQNTPVGFGDIRDDDVPF